MASVHILRLSALACALLAAGLPGTAALAQTTQTAQTGTPGNPGNPTNPPQTRLDAIRVVGSPVERADGPVEGYRATRSSTATRTDTPIEEIAQSISVVPAEVLEDLQLTNVFRALDFAGSVTPSSTAAGVGMGSYTIRGFLTGAIAYNGFVTRGEQYLHSANAYADGALIERIEVLKGPSSGLYGYSDPGGIVNIVSKRPQPERFSSYHVSAGSWDRYRGTVDLNLPLSEDGSVLSRINIVAQDNGNFRNAPRRNNQIVAPTILWHLGEDTSLFINTEFSRTSRPIDDGIFVINGNWRAMNPKTYLNEPADGNTVNKDQLLQMVLTHALNPNWDLRIAGQYKQGTRQGFGSHARRPTPPSTIAQRGRIWRDWEWHDKAIQLDAVGRFDLAGWQHQLLLGVEFDSARNESTFPSGPRSTAYGIDIYNPVYGNPNAPAIPNSDAWLYRVKTRSLNLQDQITFTDRLTGQFGVRAEHFRQDQHDRTKALNTRRAQKRTGLVPRGGLMYKVTPEIGVFGNVSASFQPNGIRQTTQLHDPEKGLGYDVGVKFDSFDGRVGATISAFHITKKNIMLRDGDDEPARYITAGEAVSKGVDMQISGQITPALRVIAAYAYTDAKITKDNRPAWQNGRLANVPRHNLGLMGVYSFESGVSTGAALTYRSKRATAPNDTLQVPAYTTVDAFARWDVTKDINVSLNLNNIFDRFYMATGGTTSGMPGEPRNVKLGVTWTM